MDLESITLSETGRSKKDKYRDFTSVWDLKNKIIEQGK